MAKYGQKEPGGVDEKGEEVNKRGWSRGLCTVWNLVTTLTKDILVGPPTNLHDCLNAFFDTSELKGWKLRLSSLDHPVIILLCYCPFPSLPPQVTTGITVHTAKG